jgi:hypothetical protein
VIGVRIGGRIMTMSKDKYLVTTALLYRVNKALHDANKRCYCGYRELDDIEWLERWEKIR